MSRTLEIRACVLKSNMSPSVPPFRAGKFPPPRKLASRGYNCLCRTGRCRKECVGALFELQGPRGFGPFDALEVCDANAFISKRALWTPGITNFQKKHRVYRHSGESRYNMRKSGFANSQQSQTTKKQTDHRKATRSKDEQVSRADARGCQKTCDSQ